MRSRGDAEAMGTPLAPVASVQALRVAGGVLHAVGLVCIALLAWKFVTPASAATGSVRVAADGSLSRALAEVLRASGDTVDVSLDGVPSAATRAALRAVRGSGHALRMTAPAALRGVAVSAEQEWKSSGGTRVQFVASDTARQAIGDAAGLLDSVRIDSAGLRTRTGPLQGALRLQRAAAAPLAAALPSEARVLVVGSATWESRFLTAALEEAGWPVDAAMTLSPKVTVTQGAAITPSRARHAIVVLLPGAPAAAVAALPAFVRSGGGLVIVGEAARLNGVAALRAGVPGGTRSGDAGAEASDEPRHGLDLVPISALVDGAVALESRDGRYAVAARRVGAGRVLQVGYENSWLWRMGGDDDAPDAHRRWWSTQLSGLVPLRAPRPTIVLVPEHDTLDAAPVAALARDLGLPTIRASSRISAPASSFVRALDARWLLTIALLSLVASWAMRRWRGLV